ncbi:MAG: tail fiber protein [Ignavibacteriae bacterium]|nr:tail fiber protein [Ignavibacteriota bacterium]
MKNIFKFSGVFLLLFGLSIPYNAFAENFTFQTSLVHTVSKMITPAAEIDCNGASTPGTPVPYDAVEVMQTPADFTVVSFRVFYTDDLNTPIYNYLNNTPAAVNFNSTTGEISFLMTGITQTRKSLTARVYLNAGGTGSPFESKEFYTSAANSNPPVGTIIPYYGTAASAAALNLGGWFLCDGTSIASISDDILFPTEKTTLQGIIGSANLPDLRGLFLRGTDPAGTYDPTAGRAIGNIQASEITGHTHNYDKTDTPTGSTGITLNTSTTTVSDDGNNQVTVIQTASLAGGGSHNHSLTYTPTATSTAGSGTETRPVNAAVNYLIKVRY